jgi:hypothetical protein
VNGERSSGRVKVPCAWWHQPDSVTALDAVKEAADALEKGLVVPRAAANLLAKALRQYLSGQTDITGNLGLRPRKGGRYEAPATKAKRTARDAAIRHLYGLVAGSNAERAGRVAELLRVPLESGRITDADVFKHLQDLHRDHGGNLPTSIRQVQRVVGGS